jgi:hypothetical protein
MISIERYSPKIPDKEHFPSLRRIMRSDPYLIPALEKIDRSRKVIRRKTPLKLTNGDMKAIEDARPSRSNKR